MRVNPDRAHAATAQRPLGSDGTSVLFRGNLAGRRNEGSKRASLLALNDLPRASIEDAHFETTSGGLYKYAAMVTSTAQAYLSSTLCLVPAGGAPQPVASAAATALYPKPGHPHITAIATQL